MKKSLFVSVAFVAVIAQSFQPVDINQASLEQIALLPGIGKKLSARIISHRKKVTSFSNINQLLQVEGISETKLEPIKTYIVVRKPSRDAKNPKPFIEEPPKIVVPKKALMPFAQLEAHALRATGLLPEADYSLSRRSRKAAWLPRLQASFNVGHGNVITEKKGESSSDSIATRGGRDFDVGVRLVFDLDRLIFNTDELEVQKLSLKRLEKREEITLKLHKNYFHYQQLMERISEPLEREAAMQITQEMYEIEAILDSMTHGEFTQFQHDTRE
jgi:competence ComEA-like helix-hairpin-helix protein